MDITPIVIAVMTTLLGGGGIAALVAYRKAPAEITEINIRASRVNVESAGDVMEWQRTQLAELRKEVKELRGEVARLTAELAESERKRAALETRIAQLGG